MQPVETKQYVDFEQSKLEELHDVRGTLVRGCSQMTGDWFISDGTALGLYRDGGFIPYDTDIDVAVMATHDQKHIKIREMTLIRTAEHKGRPIQTAYIDDNGCIFDIYYYYDDIVPNKMATYGCYGVVSFTKPVSFRVFEDFLFPGEDKYYVERFGEDWHIPQDKNGISQPYE